jgi:hypothetical protein
MKRVWMLVILIAAVVSMTACSMLPASGGNDQDSVLVSGATATPVPTPSPTPTFVPEVTITPRPIAMTVVTPLPETTPLLIDPINKPTRVPILFEFTEYTSQTMGLSFNVPAGWLESKPNDNTVQFVEPMDHAMDGFQTSLVIQVTHNSSTQTLDNARSELDNALESLKAQYPNIEVGPVGDNNKMMSETGVYVNIRITLDDDTVVRGRVYVVPKNRMLIQVRSICPGNYNTEYSEIFREIRNTAQIAGV